MYLRNCGGRITNGHKFVAVDEVQGRCEDKDSNITKNTRRAERRFIEIAEEKAFKSRESGQSAVSRGVG